MKGVRPRVRHASAELAIIVAGVLIALWADGLARSFGDRNAFRSHLSAVRDELGDEIEALDDVIDGRRHELEALQALASLDPASGLPPDSVMLRLAMDGLTDALTYEPGLTALADLESSGLLAGMGRPEIRRGLAGLRQRLNLARSQGELNITTPQHDFFDPFVLDELPFVWRRMAGHGGLEIAPDAAMDWGSLSTSRGRGLIAMRYDFIATMVEAWGELRATYLEIIDLIGAELD